MTATKKLFSVNLGGDPFSHAWDCKEYAKSLDDDICIHRGDISGRFTRDPLIRYLRSAYPGCKIRAER